MREGAAAAGRPQDAVTPGLYARVVVAETREEAEAAIDGSLLMSFIALTRPAEAFAARGAEHPLGEGAFGLTTLPADALRPRRGAAARRGRSARGASATRSSTAPPTRSRARSGRSSSRGARHVQLTNMTPLAAPALAAASEALLADTVVALRAGAPAGG